MKKDKKITDTTCTETIDNIVYEGATFNNEKTERTMQHSTYKGKSNEDSAVYESIRFERSLIIMFDYMQALVHMLLV